MSAEASPDLRAELARVLSESAAALARMHALDGAWAAACPGLMADTWRAKNPGARKLPKDVRTALGDEAFGEVKAPWQEKFDAEAAGRASLDARRDELCRLLRARPGELRVWLDEVWPSSYSSQGFGADSYARGAAEMRADVARYHGVPVEVIRVERVPANPLTRTRALSVFEVWVEVSEELDAEILRRGEPPPLREQVRFCWARGVNPRVYCPWLPHGYEEREGISYQGRDLRAAGG